MSTSTEFDQLWDYDNPSATESRFHEFLPQLANDPAKKAELLTQIARTQGLQRNFEAAHATLDGVEKSLEPTWMRAQIRYLLERGRVYNSAGHADAARSFFVNAWNLAVASDKEESLAIDAAHMIAIIESPEKQLQWNLRALEIAESAKDPNALRWKASLYNNLGWSYHEQGDFVQALAYFQKALVERQARQSLPEIRIAQWCVGRTLRSLQRNEEALALQQQLLAELDATGAKDGYVYEEIGECLLLLNRTTEAKAYFAQAYEQLSEDTWFIKAEAARLRRIYELSR